MSDWGFDPKYSKEMLIANGKKVAQEWLDGWWGEDMVDYSTGPLWVPMSRTPSEIQDEIQRIKKYLETENNEKRIVYAKAYLSVLEET